MSTTRINFKSDLPPVAVTFKINGVSVNVPDHDFAIRFFVEGAPGRSFICSKKGNDYEHCEKTNATTLICYIDNHGFGCGRLCCEFIDLSPNAKYADGKQKTVTPNRLELILVEGQGDDIVSVESSVIIDITALIADVNAALEEMEGYAAIIAALQAAVQTIPVVVDDLTTGGHTAALSAEQGKILKQLIDQLEQISIEGITGFTPISSLNDLPANPTETEKQKGYLYENAIYVWVNGGGDTLDGKYQSVDLVSLDWGDKSYAPLDFSGLGRKWLKKNIVNNANVLTSEMIGTANTEYFIQYDYEIEETQTDPTDPDSKVRIINLPANSTLVFMGGSIKNGTLVGNNTRIVAPKGTVIFDNITIQGTWDIETAWSSWFKMWKQGYLIDTITNESYITLSVDSEGVYYDDPVTEIDNRYYLTSTLEDGNVVSGSVRVWLYSYPKFKVDGKNNEGSTEYLGAPVGAAGWGTIFDYSYYESKNDTAALQNLFDLRAKKTVVEEGVYMVDCSTYRSGSSYSALFYDRQNDSELVLDGWIKAIPNSLSKYKILDVCKCKNIRITGIGGVQGDGPEHTGNSGEAGHALAVSNTKNLVVDGPTFAYAWGDCIYCSWWQYGRTSKENVQSNHTIKNVSIIYGGRTGLVYEHGDNVVVDSCYFYGNGRARGKPTKSAIDIEPFNTADTSKRFVVNYEFKNNVFENSNNGLRLERCLNCSVHDNQFGSGATGVLVVRHANSSYDITSRDDRGWVKSRLSIYDNYIKLCTNGILLGELESSENTDVYGNLLISCTKPISGTPVRSNIHDNVTYGCGQWLFGALIDTDVSNNKNYACKMPVITSAGSNGNGRILDFGNSGFDASRNSKFHDNWFSLDYGRSFFGLNANGKEELYHGLPLGYRRKLTNGIDLTQPKKVHFYNNHSSDDLHIYWGWDSSNYQGNSHFEGGMCSARTEESEVFLVGDTFKSSVYGDEGVVVKGGIRSQSWLADVRDFSEMESGDTVAYGEIIKSGSNYYVCSKAGEVGETLTGGTAIFLSDEAYDAPGGALKIVFTTRGVCTSETRPSTFLFAGRRMWETDTNKEVVYNGTAWVYNDIYTEE